MCTWVRPSPLLQVHLPQLPTSQSQGGDVNVDRGVGLSITGVFFILQMGKLWPEKGRVLLQVSEPETLGSQGLG